MESNRSKLYKGLPLSVMAESKDILVTLKSTLATNKINALFNYLRGSPNDDLTKTENLQAFLKRCVTRKVVDKIKKNNGVEETEQEYLQRISQDQYDTAKITEDIRLGLDEENDVHFYVRFGHEKDSECEVTTEDTLAVVSSVYHQFIIDLEEQEKMLLEYALTESSLKKIINEDDKDREIKSLKLVSEDMELKNHELQEELINCQKNAKKTKEEKEKMEQELNKELENNRSKLRQINVLLEKKVQKEAIMQINMKKLEMNIAELRKSLLEAEQRNKELQQKLEENKSNPKVVKSLTVELENNQQKIKELNSSLGVFGGVVSQALHFKINHLIK